MKYKIQSRDLIIVGLFIAVILLFFVKGCGGKDSEVKLLKEQLSTLKGQKAQSDKSLDSVFRKHAADSAEWEGRKQLAVIKEQEADSKVKTQQRTIDQLVAVIRGATGRPVDSSFVLVSPDFKKACEDMPAEIDRLNKTIADRDTAINQWTDILAYEVQERDGTIESLRVEVDKQKRLYEGCELVAETAIARLRPRGKLLAGAGVIGNQTTFLSGAKVMAAYQTKGGKQYQGGAILMGGTVWYEAGVMVQLFK
jgi:hypothetical protein